MYLDMQIALLHSSTLADMRVADVPACLCATLGREEI